MKKYLTYTLILFVGILLNGCKKDFLTLVPYSQYSVSGSYKTQSDFTQAIAAVYSQQQALYSPADSYFRGLIGRSDETIGSTGAGNLVTYYLYGLNVFTDDATNPWELTGWQIYWKIISRCNIILDKIDAVEFTDVDLKNYIKGEAYILRAYAYWNLASQYGGMPLISKTMTVDEIKTIARSSMDETLAFAAEDYKKAIGLLPAEWKTNNIGRATKYAAEGMLARLYLFQANFSAAEPLLNDIISSGNYAMETDYVNCFTDSHDNGKERVWEVQFTGGQLGEGSRFPTGCLPEGIDKNVMPFPGVSTSMNVSLSLYKAFESGDKRRNLSILKNFMNSGIQDTTDMLIVKYIHYDTYTPKDAFDWANNFPILRYTDVKMMYAEVLNEQGYVPNGEAFSILNEIRTRAGIPTLSSIDLPNKEAFRNAIIKERRVEFAFEGLRWFDLVRWGVAQNVMNSFFALPEQGKGLYAMKSHQTIFPIPYNELTSYNDTKIMWQNPGY